MAFNWKLPISGFWHEKVWIELEPWTQPRLSRSSKTRNAVPVHRLLCQDRAGPSGLSNLDFNFKCGCNRHAQEQTFTSSASARHQKPASRQNTRREDRSVRHHVRKCGQLKLWDLRPFKVKHADSFALASPRQASKTSASRQHLRPPRRLKWSIKGKILLVSSIR